MNYNGAAGALNNINALFPDDYRVKIDGKAWAQAIDDKIFYICTECQKEIPRTKVEIFTKNNNLIVTVLANSPQTEVWRCPECRVSNQLELTTIRKIRAEEPYYLKVVPDCPIRTSGLQNRLGYHQKFSKWFYKYLEELEYQLGLYRIEYAAQIDDEPGLDYDDDGDNTE